MAGYLCMASIYRTVASVLILSAASACAAPSAVHRQYLTMGTFLQVSIYGGSVASASAAADTAAQSIFATEQRLSNWRASSELSLYNTALTGQTPSTVSAALQSDLALAETCRMATDGYFQPRVGAAPSLPVTEATSPISIDSSGFGKGLALDLAAKHAHFPPDSLVFLNLGGQVYVQGAVISVPLADPGQRGQSGGMVRVRSGQSLSVSGLHLADADSGITAPTVAHIVNPHTASLVAAPYVAVVRASSGFWADCASTAIYAAGPTEAARLWQQLQARVPDLDAALLDRDSTGNVQILWKSPGWRSDLIVGQPK